MFRRIMITLGVLVTVVGARNVQAQNCKQCVYNAPNFQCVGGQQFGWRSCQVVSGGCYLQWECGPERPSDVATAVVLSSTGGLSPASAGDRHAPVFAVLAVGRRVERGCGGKVTARLYDDRTQQALRVKSKRIVV